MRVFVTTGDRIHPIKGGGALRTTKIAGELWSQSHEVTLLAPSEGEGSFNGIKVISVPEVTQEKSIILGPILFTLTSFLALCKNRNKIDLVISHNSVAAIPSLIFTKIFRKKFVLDITDIQTEYFKETRKGFLWSVAVYFMIMIEVWLIKHSGRVVVVSKIMKDTLVRKGVPSERIFVVYDGVETEKFSLPKKKQPHPVIIHHGSISPHDGVEYIPYSAVEVLKKYPTAKFYIVGSGNRIHAVREIVKRFDLEPSFVFTGWKPYEEMKSYLQIADIGLITRPNTLANNAVLTLKLLEYWASGTAPIAARLKGIQEISEENENVLFFTPESPLELAGCIIRLIEDPLLLARIQGNGQKVAQRFDWGSLIKEIVHLSIH
ncbi:MAG: glycosyltransferase family 4 protein [Candidatus Omnitrophica bacterium]|nr:glycosyltransferase family 4 protein [Candidatus Omnitrophota bacterium]